MFINNVKALLSIAYRISFQNHVRVLSMTNYRKPLFQNFQLSNFHHKEEKTSRAKELTLLASNRWRQWSQAATPVPAISSSTVMLSFMQF